jgi:excisionase family DNA binding protein
MDGTDKDNKYRREEGPGVAKLPHLLTIAEVAEWLGVSERHIRRLVHERRIPHMKLGHFIRFEWGDVRDWLDRARRPEEGAGAAGRAS